MNRADSEVVSASVWLARHAGALTMGLALAVMMSVPRPTWGQWSGTSPVWTTSNVGIGTPTPSSMFKLHTVGMIASDQGSNVYTVLGQDPGSYASTNITGAGMWYDTASNSLRITALTGGVAWRNVVINGNGAGNVAIGTMNPGTYRLAVEGNIGARDIIVTTQSWSDYVFQPGYRLRPLSEVGAYIQANHHLPDIPSEAEVKAKGVSVGEMQAKLLAKVEELTLHMIQAEKENQALRDRLARLEQGANAIAAAAK